MGTSCPEARFIDEFTETGNQTSDALGTTTGSHFIACDVTSANPTGPSTSGDARPSVNICVKGTRNIGGNASQTRESAGETLVSKLPGAYLLDIVATRNADDYVVSVEECGGNSPSPDQIQGNTTPSSNPNPNLVNQPRNSPLVQKRALKTLAS